MAKRGVLKDFDKETFENALKVQCNQEEICAILGAEHKTINKWIKRTYGSNETFATVSKIFQSVGKASLRRQLFKRTRVSDKVLIFAAKNYLGMSDNPTSEENGEEALPIAEQLLNAINDNTLQDKEEE